MKTKSFFLSILILSILSLQSEAQTLTLKLWESNIPGAIKSADYKDKTIPEIYVYLPKSEKANGTAVLICPGGGYGGIAIDHEGKAIALWLNEQGIAGIVLEYRLPSDKIMKDKKVGPLQDVQEGMRVIRRNAKKWNINPNKVGVIGFSAGGHLASTLSTHYNEKVYQVADTVSARPTFSILIYPVISFESNLTHMGSRENLIGQNQNQELIKHFSNDQQITADTPPAFLINSVDDTAVPFMNSVNYFMGLQKFNIPAELHLYQKGGHGYGMGQNLETASTWPGTCLLWLKANGWL